MIDADDEKHLARAVALSRERMEAGLGGPFGAVIVRGGETLSEGWNEVTSCNDPTAHAEVVAIRRACTAVNSFSLAGATLYTSCEPCPMCLGALYWARPRAVYFASGRETAARAGFDDAFIYAEIGKPFAERSLRLRQLIAAEGDRAFDEWARKPDKTPY